MPDTIQTGWAIALAGMNHVQVEGGEEPAGIYDHGVDAQPFLLPKRRDGAVGQLA